jgi:ubiquitin carboxyl-terminal hydrolase 14
MYDETDDHGHHKQQDADECFQSSLQSWRRPLEISTKEDLIGNLFEIELQSELKCVEAPDEPATFQNEKVLRLSCHIDNNNNPINMLWEGIKISLEGDIEKRSQTLGRDAVYHKTSRINKLVSLHSPIMF